MSFKLIQQLNESVREKDEFETALAEAGIEFDMGDGETADVPATGGTEYDDIEDVIDRLIDAYKSNGYVVDKDMGSYTTTKSDMQGTAEEMSDDDLQDAIGDDLEQLGFSPEDIADGIERVMAGLGRAASGDDFDDEGQPSEYEEWQDLDGGDDWDHGQYDE